MKPAYLGSNAHTHCSFCDGKCTPEQMVQGALEKGFHTLGFSSHSPLPKEKWTLRDPEAYQAEIARLKECYADRITLVCGIEWDSDSEQSDREGYAYNIGSVHRLQGPRTGKRYEVDHSLNLLEECRLTEYEGDGLAMAKDYLTLVGQMVEKRPTILGHMDLIRKLNSHNRVFDEKDKSYQQLALEVLEKAARAGILVEMNTGGSYRGYRKDPYPANVLLPEFARMGGRLILTSDSHDAKSLGWQFEEAAASAKRAGFQELYYLGPKGFAACELQDLRFD